MKLSSKALAGFIPFLGFMGYGGASPKEDKPNQWRRSILGIILVSFACFCSCNMKPFPAEISIELSSGWQFREAGEGKWMPAEVPGTVHTDLLKNGMIADPFYRMNETDLQWVETRDWEYRTVFTVGRKWLQQDNIVLSFKGLDTYADVYLNGHLILEASNMFVGWDIPCRDKLLKGKNELLILFRSPVNTGMEKLQQIDYIIPSINEQAPVGKRTSVFTRKSPFHYGWDWGPRLVTSGIWRPVVLKAWSKAQIEDVYLKTITASKKEAGIIAQATVLVDLAGTYDLDLFFDGERVAGSRDILLDEGQQDIRFDFTLDDPQLWWTNGLGKPYLYDVSFELSQQSRMISKHELLFGVRTLKLVQEPDQTGRSFFFELNGVPVFMKGANVIPSETLTPSVTAETYHGMVRNAVAANMNMLRVWGGAIYEEDLFYELCSRNGLLVWQDFMFACNLQPGDQAHLDNIRLEAEYNVKRLRNNACIALWCGNNENLHGWHHWGWNESFEPAVREFMWQTYQNIFYEILPEAVRKYDPKTSYWSSSPSAYDNQLADRKSGDEHDWTIWFGQQPFSAFGENVPRFVSEWGLQAFPGMNTINQFSLPEDHDIHSAVMRHRQRSSMAWLGPGFDGNDMIKRYMDTYYNVPDDFEDFVYVSQLLQAKGYKTAIEAHRRAMPHCMGSLYWQLNDCWPTISWATVDYYGRWKASHYAVRKAFEEVLPVIYEEDNRVRINVVSDRTEPAEVQLHIRLMDFDGHIHYQSENNTVIPANTSTPVFEKTYGELGVSENRRGQVVLHAWLTENGHRTTENILYFTEPKNLQLPVTDIQTTLTRTTEAYLLVFTSQKLVRNLFVDCTDPDASFSDNYFDLLPGQPKTIMLATDMEITREDIRLKYLNNL